MEETKKQPSPVMGSTRAPHRQPKYIDPMPRLVQVILPEQKQHTNYCSPLLRRTS
jgi:hypothetical protein